MPAIVTLAVFAQWTAFGAYGRLEEEPQTSRRSRTMPDDDSDELAKRRRKRAEDANPKPPRTPKTQSSPGRTPPAEPPRRTAIGYSGDWGNYKPGQKLICKVIAKELGGYAVVIIRDDLEAFLPTDQELKVGDEVIAQFVCMSGLRALLQPMMSVENVKLGLSEKLASSWREKGPINSTWKQTGFRHRRAIDLIPLPVVGEMPAWYKLDEHGPSDLVTDLEGNQQTGCLRFTSPASKSRGTVLLLRGRATGCIYGNRHSLDPVPTEPSLRLLFRTLIDDPSAEVLIHDLPEEVVLPMSALFLGYAVERKDSLDAPSYIEYMLGWLKGKELTACLTVSQPTTLSTALAFICEGDFVGTFYVEDQTFSTEIDYLNDLVAKDALTRVEPSILPPEMHRGSLDRFGFNLRMALSDS